MRGRCRRCGRSAANSYLNKIKAALGDGDAVEETPAAKAPAPAVPVFYQLKIADIAHFSCQQYGFARVRFFLEGKQEALMCDNLCRIRIGFNILRDENSEPLTENIDKYKENINSYLNKIKAALGDGDAVSWRKNL